ncbi:light-sensor Protein kinase isoform X1 [Dendrobium catenatum]|uniref:Light-sensor Protein kinase n=1 Tax=Dendrobium catenatum TaxID=906689 RepID=A0A2I0X228_9ASPA|nr:light-sensor Protein kinase isoform X1 [Dendrobium catenatum]XP_020703587.1 light-sensor Protein kinase isoform X1 [Dendrobium catenatum]PKU81960.1 Light-sensor Protein kinase [Dendrobium catenatum]
MEQFRHIGEVLGSIRALMVFREEIRINPRQCQLLFDAFEAAFAGVSYEIRQNLRLDEKQTKWMPLEQPLKELHRVFREGEQYIHQCLEPKDWWGRSIFLTQSADCVEHHLHNLLCSIPVILEAIENIGEVTGDGHEDIHRRRVVFTKKCEKEWMEPKLFRHRFGDLYLVSKEMCKRIDVVAKEDKWALLETIDDMRSSLSKQENRLAELLKSPRGKIHPISMLTSSPDYQFRRRLGASSHLKEIHWMGERFALKHVFCDVEQLMPETSLLSSLTHPNVLHYMYCFSDEEKKECYMVMELMNKDLSSYIKEIFCARRKFPFPLSHTVNIMLQIARGMEYLHSKKIYHGDLKPSNILVKTKNSSSSDAYVHVKIAGLAQSAAKVPSSPATGKDPCIWYAPEVLSDQEQQIEAGNVKKYTEKADVYSFGMICFELLTGKVPFEEGHLQGDKMSKNIRLGERPLFPFPSPKFLTNLTKKCWLADPNQRPSFSSICRILRYIKRFMIMNPDNGQSDPPSPPLDYFDIETNLSKKFDGWERRELLQVYDIPFEMYAYRVIERERASVKYKEENFISSSDASLSGEENRLPAVIQEDALSLSVTSSSSGSVKSAGNLISNGNKKTLLRKVEINPRTSKPIGKHNVKLKLEAQSQSPPPRLLSNGRGMRLKSENRLQAIKQVAMSPLRYPVRRKKSGHASDSDI